MLSTFSMQTISYSPVTSYTSVTSGSLTRLWVTFSSSLDSTNRFRKTRTSLGMVDNPLGLLNARVRGLLSENPQVGCVMHCRLFLEGRDLLISRREIMFCNIAWEPLSCKIQDQCLQGLLAYS